MSTLRRFAPALLIVAAAAGLLYLGWSMLEHPSEPTCSVCGRSVHPASRVDGVAEGKSLSFCCAACALRSEEQGLSTLKITRLYDYDTGKAIDPAGAYSVIGSQVNMCMRQHVLIDAAKEASHLDFDRCEPSILSFADRAAAERFVAEHGGVARPFPEVEKTVK